MKMNKFEKKKFHLRDSFSLFMVEKREEKENEIFSQLIEHMKKYLLYRGSQTLFELFRFRY